MTLCPPNQVFMNKITAVNDLTISVELDKQTIVVSKLPLKKYSELLLKLDKLPQQLSDFESTGADEIFNILPKMVAASLNEVVDILVIATNLTREEIENMGLDEVVKLLAAIIEVNKFAEVYSNLKKIFARPTTTNQ